MGALSAFLRNSEDNGLMFWCPGCNEAHQIKHGTGTGPRWGWNGDVEKPVFTPSVLVTGTQWPTDDEHARLMRGEHVAPRPMVCHSFVGCNGAAPGQITFLGDCTHALAGKTVDLPPWPIRDTSPPTA